MPNRSVTLKQCMMTCEMGPGERSSQRVSLGESKRASEACESVYCLKLHWSPNKLARGLVIYVFSELSTTCVCVSTGGCTGEILIGGQKFVVLSASACKEQCKRHHSQACKYKLLLI